MRYTDVVQTTQSSESSSQLPKSFIDEDPGLAEDTRSPSIPGPSFVPDYCKQALQRLVSCAAPKDELVSLVEAIFSSGRVSNIVGCLGENNAQTFIDAVDEVCHHGSDL